MRYFFCFIPLCGLIILNSCKKDKEPKTPPPGIAFLVQKDASTVNLWYTGTDGGSFQQVLHENLGTHGNNPAWSADGRKIYFIHSGTAPGVNGIYRIKPDGSDYDTVYKDDISQVRNYYQLVTSDDDQHVVFSFDIPRTNRTAIELYRMCPCGRRVERLTEFEIGPSSYLNTEAYAGSFSPNDTALVFCQTNPTLTGRKPVKIYRINMASRVLTLLTTIQAIDVAGCTPSYSPDGQKLLLSIDGLIHIMNADGTGLERLGTIQGYRPTWDPNGTDFYFSSYTIPGMQQGIYRTDIHLTRITMVSKYSSIGKYGGFGINH